MKLKIERLKIVAATADGPFGTDVAFADGLNILRADNSSGKSTLANAILYGLGLEGMLGPSWPRPLKYALYERLTDDNNREHSVQESYVLLEISNDRGETWTLKRQVHGGPSTDLVQLWDGRAITSPGTERKRGDAFVRLPGSASREAGFHTQLSRFIGWDLPDVVTTDGGHSLLYLQLLFPLLFVEQSRGWTGVRENVPRFLRIREPDLRAVQFLLSLEAADRAGQREELDAAISQLRERWARVVGEFRGTLRGDAATVQGVSDAPTASWPPEPPPSLVVYHDDERTPISQALLQLRARLRELREQEIPTVFAAAEQTQDELAAAERKHREMAAARSQLMRDLAADDADLRRIDERLEALETDRKRHRDAVKVVELGGTPVAELQEGRCPTCDQHWPSNLLGGDVQAVMTFDDNIAVIEQEQRALKALRVGAAAALDDRRSRLLSLSDAWFEVQADIRALREVLVQDGRAPSAAAVRERLVIEGRIERLSDLDAELDALVEQLAPMAAEFGNLKSRRAVLAGDNLSDADQQKATAWERSLLDQLQEYGFRSTGGVQLSRSTLLPEREGLNLTHEASASDTIRLIWAYLIGLLETARTFPTNHPGLLILDEPGQQDVEDSSVRTLMERASAAVHANQQVIITITRPTSAFMSASVISPTVVDYRAGQRVLAPLDR